jgi:hypothetical protein
MQLHKPMERIAELSQSVGAWVLVMTCAIYGCTREPLPGEGDDDSQPLADVPADLPVEPTEFEGILYARGYPNEPTQFRECETEEVFEMSYVGQQGELWSGSCDGVYHRVRGMLDRSFDPPRLIIEETLEARWSVPSDCAFFHEPDYISCHFEDESASFICEPADIFLCDAPKKCSPVHFFASESAGWKHHECLGSLGDGVAGDPCEYPEAGGGEMDTCAQGNRCWNPTGDLTAPGICVPYCDLTGEFGPTCEGTCVRCSSSAQDGLCMTDCSGENCNVDAFC